MPHEPAWWDEQRAKIAQSAAALGIDLNHVNLFAEYLEHVGRRYTITCDQRATLFLVHQCGRAWLWDMASQPPMSTYEVLLTMLGHEAECE